MATVVKVCIDPKQNWGDYRLREGFIYHETSRIAKFGENKNLMKRRNHLLTISCLLMLVNHVLVPNFNVANMPLNFIPGTMWLSEIVKSTQAGP